MDNSLQNIQQSIAEKQSFILEAGAGSGKTWSLVESIKYIINHESQNLAKHNRKIACITYTNVAANEIIERIDNNPLVNVETIHNFLWSIIGGYTEELKSALLEYNDSLPEGKKISNLRESLKNIRKIEYNQYKRDYLTGQLWHDDIIILSKILFDKSMKLALFTVNEYPYMFVDEYQDTFPQVVDILLKDIYSRFNDKVIIGFFGDSMQKIYDRGIGKIDLTDFPNIKLITKSDNFRCSKKVIELLNHIRPELVQYPSGHNAEGEISFYYGNENYPSETILMEKLKQDGWEFDNNKSKVLYLTHRKIAIQGGYEKLLNAFPNRDRFFERGDLFSSLLFETEDVCKSYSDKNYSTLFDRLKSNGFKIQKHSDKKIVQEYIEKLTEFRRTKTIEEVLDFLLENPVQIFQLQDYTFFLANIESPEMEENRKIYFAIKSLPFQEVTNWFNYIEKNTIYSTKHGVKGTEFDNVLVIVDDSAWRNFSDNEVFSNNKHNINRYDRSRNLLYVCCSRPKKRLALYSITPMSTDAQKTISSWFGSDNVYK